MALPWSDRRAIHAPSQSDPTTRWQHARTIYAQYRRDPEVRAAWWRSVALLSVVGSCVLGVGVIRLAHRPTVEPHYVYVTPTGHVVGTEKISAKPYSVDEEMLRHLTVEWIEWVRSIPLDPTILHKNWQKATAMSTDVAAQRLYAYAKAIDLTALAQKAARRELAVKITIESVLTISERVIKVVWRETVYDGANQEKETAQYTGELEYIIRKPQTQKELDQNALGIWLARFVWGKNMT
jgi:type IV secretory pathway TrbF-like protein